MHMYIRIRVQRFSTSGADSLWEPPGLGSSQQRRLATCAAAAPGGRGAAHLRQGRRIRQGRLAAARAAAGVGCLVDGWWWMVDEGRPWRSGRYWKIMIDKDSLWIIYGLFGLKIECWEVEAFC